MGEVKGEHGSGAAVAVARLGGGERRLRGRLRRGEIAPLECGGVSSVVLLHRIGLLRRRWRGDNRQNRKRRPQGSRHPPPPQLPQETL